MHRTHTCGELRAEHSGQTVTLAGWVDDIRDMGGLSFLTLRDRYGTTQIQVGENAKLLKWENASDNSALQDFNISSVKPEYCVKIVGTVVARPEGQANKDMDTGDIEIELEHIEVLTACKELPFPIRDEPNTSEENRFKHRYLDLRRAPVLENIKFRAQMNHFTRNWFTHADFLEIQTPIFTVSSPEWARDYVIPSRVNPGKFYALPQAPQQYKQLLMVGWVDKYFQIAPCFRDEDPRADRHSCEFYQVDAEMSFVEQQDVFDIAEAYMTEMIEYLVPDKSISVEFAKIPHEEAMSLYGSDKPDLRFDMQFVDISEIVKSSDFGVFANTVKDGWIVKAVKLDQQSMTRKEIDAITEIAKQAGAGGLAYLLYEAAKDWVEYVHEGIRSPIAKFFSKEEIDAITELTMAEEGDILFFGAGPQSLVHKVMNKVRLYCRDMYNLVNKDELAFCWITDFPFYEYDEGQDRWDFGHNPFSHVLGWVEALKKKDFAEIQTNQYDMVLNGHEILSGSIRNSNPEVMVAAFEKLGMSEDDVKERFGAMYEAFQYGAPPHGWFAFGFDRIMMILLDEPNIRECYAFPKSWRAEDVMMWAPNFLEKEQLDELNIDLVEDTAEPEMGNPEVYEAIRELLHDQNIEHRHIEHAPTRTSQESADVRGESLKIWGKALLVKIDNDFKLFVLSAEKKLSMEKMRSKFETKKIRFATKEELQELTWLVPGSVPPFGDPLLPFPLYVDVSITENDKIAFNAGLLTQSIIFSVSDYLEVAKGEVVDIGE